MSSRLAFQTQLASIMEVLANAAVAEICKLVDDEYAVVSLQMSQCQRENKALKRKLHLLELKMARGNAERRLRESAMNSSRPRVQIHPGDRVRESFPSTSAVFERQMAVALWSGRAAAGGATGQPVHSDSIHSKSPDVELVEPEALLVKEEKVEANMSRAEETEEDVPLIGDDGVLECVPRGAAGQRLSPEQQDIQSQSQSQTQIQMQNSRRTGNSRGAEVSDSSPLLKCDLSSSDEGRDSLQETVNPTQYVDDVSSDSQFDVLCDNDKSADSLVEEFFDEPLGAEMEGQTPSCSYSMAAADFPSTSSSVNGWACYGTSFPISQPFSDSKQAHHRPGPKERLFVCSYCGKAFNRPKKVEIHQRVHTGEKPFSCSTCGKTFSEAGNLRKHQRVHTGEKPYSCGMCGRGFAWIRNLKTHQQKSHPEIHPEEESWEQTRTEPVDAEPEVVLVKMEEVELVTGPQSQASLSIQEGLVESSTDNYRGALPFDETAQASTNQLSDLQEAGGGFSEVSYGRSSLWTNGGGSYCHDNSLPGPSSHCAPLSYLPGRLIGAEPGSSGRGLAVEGSAGRGLAVESSRGFHTSVSFEQQHPVIDLSEESSPIQVSGHIQGGQLAVQRPPPFLDLGPSKAKSYSSADMQQKVPRKRVYMCRFCGKGFSSPANLESHLRTHTGERPYGCSICGKKFSQFWNLKIHRNIHTGERPYQCLLCPERFSDPSNLKKHQKRHHTQSGTGQLPIFTWTPLCVLLIQSSVDVCCAAPQSTPMISEDSIGVVSVQLRVPDTNTPANPNTPPPPPPQRSSNTLSSKYSLFELDTFLSRWATDSDPVPTPGGPSCPFTADDTPECDQDRVIIVEEEPSVSSAVRISGGQSLSAGRSSGDIQPTASQAGGISVSTPLRMQAPSSQRPWSRTITTNRRAQSQLLQQPRSSSSSEQQETVPLSSSRAAVTNTNSGDETSVSGISSTCRTMSSTVAPQAALPLRGSTAVLASIEAAIAAQRRAGLLACHSKSQAAGVAPAERRRKSYVCRACGKAFSGLSNLEAHERVHTGEKPFRCNTCGKHFSEAGNLKKHQRVHTGEKPFSCDQCGKKFAWICNLRTHQQSATGCGPQDRGGGGLA
ncbi:uncharacterized protein LOC111647637 [Seriola lalandi dorsalis]|uniref:uncharacterized protein LOC111647637 n=1 Tax=Seriola lalandi dorsalis TaxID=1841481 RepID=UPI000C6FBB2E|nr:uncharacterized protein LOC111647637 [Seriola lalandi dorsalis]